MSSTDAAHHEALVRLAASTAEAIAQTLEMFAPGEVTRGEVTVLGDDARPFAGLEPGSAAAGVSYVDGVTGANVFLAPPGTARMLAARMGMPDALEQDGELGELELSAVSEAANQMMAAAAGAIGVVLGQEVEISPPTTVAVSEDAEAEELFGTAPMAASTSFLFAGEPCRLVQLVPTAFVVRIARALEARQDESVPADARRAPEAGETPTQALADALSDIKLRVWAELGRTRMPFGDALELPLGSVVELDEMVEAPIDLYVNGLRFAQGRLMVSDDGRWVFQLDALVSEPAVPSLSVPTL
jgi:flagellar motor switch protein FliN